MKLDILEEYNDANTNKTVFIDFYTFNFIVFIDYSIYFKYNVFEILKPTQCFRTKNSEYGPVTCLSPIH